MNSVPDILACRLKALVAAGISLIATLQANAQPIFASAESIEATVANADFVVVGTLIEFDASEQTDERDGREWREAVLAVDETLKGEHHNRLDVRLSDPVSALADWKDRSDRLLVAGHVDPPARTTVIDLTSSDLAVMTADSTVLRDSEDVIRSAKETVRRMPGVRRIETFSLMVPPETLAGTKWAKYFGLNLSVPVDDRLEKRAHALIRLERYGERHEGIRALRYFKSDENIERAKALLNDPGWAYRHHAHENDGLEVRIYGVRQEAYRTLKAWGVNVEKPTIREETWTTNERRIQ